MKTATTRVVGTSPAEIPLTKGFVALVDEADVPLVGGYNWCALDSTQVVYAIASIAVGKAQRQSVLMHRLIMGAPDGAQVHHVSGDGLDNRRSNLRIVSPSQNQAARRTGAVGSSGYRGVSWKRGKDRWCARIRVKRSWYHLGYFDDPAEAARAYDRAAINHFGEFARLNFPEVTP